MSDKNLINNQSSISLCQPSCGYYFSSGFVISETVYSSASHGALYNAASRIIIDGGGKALRTAALGGMLAQNFTLPGWTVTTGGADTSGGGSSGGSGAATSIIIVSGSKYDSTFNSEDVVSVISGGILNANRVIHGAIVSVLNGGLTSNNAIRGNMGSGYPMPSLIVYSGGIATSNRVSCNDAGCTSNSGAIQYVSSGGVATNTSLGSGGYEIIYTGGKASFTNVSANAAQIISSGGIASNTSVYTGGQVIVSSGGKLFVNGISTINVLQVAGGNIDAVVKGGDTLTYVSGTNANGAFYLQNGVASNFVIYAGGSQIVSSGGIARGTKVSGGALYVYANGTASNAFIYCPADNYVYGITSGTTVYGAQYIYNGGIDRGANVNGEQYIIGTASNATVYGTQIVSTGGVASNAAVKNGGNQNVYGSSYLTTVSSGGSQTVYAGTATSTTVAADGVQTISGGVDQYAIVNGTQTIRTGGIASNATINSGGNQNVSGSAYMATVNNGGTQNVNYGGKTTSTTVNYGGIQNVSTGGIASNATIFGIGLASAVQNVYGSAVSTTLNSKGYQYVYGAGTADTTTINAGGWQIVSSTENVNAARYAKINLGGSQTVHSGATALYATINGGLQTVSLGGTARGTLINAGTQNLYGNAFDVNIGTFGVQNVRDGGVDTSASIDGGLQNVYGRANYTVINGTQIISSGGVASFTTINSGGLMDILFSGVASDTTINAGGTMNVRSGGSAMYFVDAEGAIINAYDGAILKKTREYGIVNIYSGATDIGANISKGSQVVHSSGLAIDAQVNESGYQIISDGGIASGTIINNGGNQNVYGSAYRATVSSGGSQTLYAGANATADNISGTQNIFSGGVASNALIYANGIQNLSGSSISATVRGTQNVYSGAADASAAISGLQNVYGSAAFAEVHSLGSQVIGNGGIANNASVSSGATQTVSVGGIASGAFISAGGSQGVYGKTDYAVIRGTQTIFSGGSAARTTVMNGGIQNISRGGSGISTTVENGGLQHVLSGGEAHYAVVSSGGIDIDTVNEGDYEVSEGGVASGTKIKGGTQNVYSGGTTSNIQISNGGQQVLHSGATDIRTTISSGGVQIVQGGTASQTAVNSGASQTITSSGSALNVSIYAGGMQTVSGLGTTAENTTVYSGASQVVSDNASVSGTVLNSGATQLVSGAGATAQNTIVGEGATQSIRDGAAAVGATVSGMLHIGAGAGATNLNVTGKTDVNGTVSSANISRGGSMEFNDGSVGGNIVAENGGKVLARENATITDTTIGNNGVISVFDNGVASNTLINAGGYGVFEQGAEINGLDVNGNYKNSGKAVLKAKDDDYEPAFNIQGSANLGSNGNIAISRGGNEAPATMYFDTLHSDKGIITLNMDISQGNSDKIDISSSYSGNTILDLSNVGKSAGDASKHNKDNPILIATFKSNNPNTATFTLPGDRLSIGAYKYALMRDSEDTGGDTTYSYSIYATEEPTATFQTVISMPKFNSVGITAALNSLQKRLGDIHKMDSSDAVHGTWARGYYKSKTITAGNDTDFSATGIEAGYDYRHASGDGSVYLGLMAGSMTTSVSSEEKLVKTDGSGSGMLGGVYGTYISESGWFTDITLRGGNTSTDMTVEYTDDGNHWDKITFTPKRSFIAASLEIGKASSRKDSQKPGFHLEPKAEIQITNMGKHKSETSDGLTLEYAGATHVSGIGTLMASYTVKRNSGLITEPYLEIAYTNEFSGKEKVVYDDNETTTEAEGGSMEGRAGINMQLTRNLYWYAAASFESGDKVSGLGADFGIRYSFGGRNNAVEDNGTSSSAPKIPEKPRAVNPDPGNNVTETRYDVYQQLSLSTEEINGTIKIPSIGILFQAETSALQIVDTQILDAFAALYRRTDGKARILLEGFSSNLKDETENNPLIAAERINSVEKYLIEKGIPQDMVDKQDHSNKDIRKRLFAGDTTCRGNACNMRVNISIQNDQGAK